MSTARVAQGALWFGVVAPPAAWFLHLVVSFILVGHACDSGRIWPLHLTTGATLALASSATAVAWRSWRRLSSAAGEGDEAPAGWSRFLALSGVGLGVGFALTIALAGFSPFIVDPCAL